ncbi:hypothetical protein ISS85_03605 [Candidatus Microgenomates bacterium]|nr:hypothetical protein [Candidatus Microgenomates bacterium]
MKKLLSLILILIFLTLITNYSITNYCFSFTPACDPCGFCVGAPDPPANYDACMDCLFKPDDTPKEGFTWTVLGCIPSDAGGFIQIILQTAVKMIGGVAFLALLYGGFLLLTSSGDIQKINKGKTIVGSAIVGLLMILFSVFILRTIGYEILRIPGFGG